MFEHYASQFETFLRNRLPGAAGSTRFREIRAELLDVMKEEARSFRP